MTFEEAGLLPPPSTIETEVGTRVPHGRQRRLVLATEALLSAIETETGWRPAVDDEDEAPPHPVRELRRRAGGWSPERTRLAAELLRAIDTNSASLRSVRRARAALEWDRRLGAYRSEVDDRLVNQALQRVDSVLASIDGEQHAPPPLAVEVRAFDWPVSPVRITSAYGHRYDPFGDGVRLHVGVDLAALEGQSVYAATDGVVTFAGIRGGYGMHVELRHEDSVVTRYAHLSDIHVRKGARVGRGQLLGRAGQTGRATGPHLHFEMWRGGLPVDPVLEIDGWVASDEPRTSRSLGRPDSIRASFIEPPLNRED